MVEGEYARDDRIRGPKEISVNADNAMTHGGNYFVFI